MVNSKRPQTSYGGISARQKSLQKSLRQKSSKVAYNGENKFEELFPGPSNADINLNLDPNSNYIAAVGNYDMGLKNKLSKSKNII
jgi:hypothetical protein